MLTQCIVACLTSEATKTVRVLPLYGKMLVDWCVYLHIESIQLQNLNINLSIF